MTQFHVASSFGYKLFEIESLEDLSFEKYKVLIALYDKMQEEYKITDLETRQDPKFENNSKKRTTFRIINKE